MTVGFSLILFASKCLGVADVTAKQRALIVFAQELNENARIATL